MKWLSWIGIFCLSFGELLAQGNGMFIHHLTVEDGLTEGTNYFVSKDSRGFVWISSTNGLNRYDGGQVQSYLPGTEEDSTSLLGENIQSKMFEVENGDLWFTTYEGVNLYQRKTGNFWHTRLVDSTGEIVKGYQAFHLDSKGYLWMIIDNKEVQVFNIKTRSFHYKFSLLQNTLRISLLLANDGGILQALSRNQKHTLTQTIYNQDDTFTQFSRQLMYHGDTVKVVQILPMSDSLYWLATGNGFFSYNWKNDELYRYSSFGDKELKACLYAVHYTDNNLLLAFENEGILVFDTETRKFTKQIVPDLRNPNTLSTSSIPVINPIADGSYWLTAEPNGIDYFYPAKKKFNVISLPLHERRHLTPFDVTYLLEDSSGNIWCGTSNQSLQVFNTSGNLLQDFQHGGYFSQYSLSKEIHNLFEDEKGRIWIMSLSGTMVWLPDKNRFIRITDDFTSYGIQLSDKRIILSPYSPGGLVEVFEPKSGQFQLKKITSVDSTGTYSLLWQDNEDRLFGCKELISISIFDPANDFKLIKELPYAGYSSLFQEPNDSSLWISNSYGLIKLSATLEESTAVKFTLKDGLPSSQIWGLLPDNAGNFWISTSNGLSRFNITSNQFQNFTLSDGLPSLNLSRLARLKRRDGELWFGTTNGIVRFYPSQVKIQENTTAPVITSILVNDVELPGLKCSKTGATNISELQRIELGSEQNTLSFTFAALDYTDPGNVLFSFQMENLDADWLTPASHDFTRYAKIPSGDYVFKLKAMNSDGQWGPERHLKIKIDSPFYRKWWFYTLMGALGASVVYMITWFRQQKRNRIKKNEEDKRHALELERQRIARDMHDDLGSSLSALSLTTEIARHKKSSELKEEIEKINSTTREISSKIREVIWTVSSRNDSLENLISYLNNYALDLFESASQDFNLSLPENIPEIFINGEYRRNIFLAFKEALNNLMKYAEATKVVIDFEIIGGQFSIWVKDNGKGFNPDLLKNSTGNGLRNMQSRLKDIGGTCEIKTGKAGTTIHFGFQLTD